MRTKNKINMIEALYFPADQDSLESHVAALRAELVEHARAAYAEAARSAATAAAEVLKELLPFQQSVDLADNPLQPLHQGSGTHQPSILFESRYGALLGRLEAQGIERGADPSSSATASAPLPIDVASCGPPRSSSVDYKSIAKKGPTLSAALVVEGGAPKSSILISTAATVDESRNLVELTQESTTAESSFHISASRVAIASHNNVSKGGSSIDFNFSCSGNLSTDKSCEEVLSNGDRACNCQEFAKRGSVEAIIDKCQVKPEGLGRTANLINSCNVSPRGFGRVCSSSEVVLRTRTTGTVMNLRTRAATNELHREKSPQLLSLINAQPANLPSSDGEKTASPAILASLSRDGGHGTSVSSNSSSFLGQEIGGGMPGGSGGGSGTDSRMCSILLD